MKASIRRAIGELGFVATGRVWQDASGACIRWIVSTGLLFGLVACATAPTTEADVKKLVAERATARWQALIKGDLDRAYDFLSQSSKETTPLDRYKAKIKNNIWKAVEVKTVDCEANVCKVDLEITYDLKAYKGIKTDLTESWVIEGGTARFVYKG